MNQGIRKTICKQSWENVQLQKVTVMKLYLSPFLTTELIGE